MPRSLPHVRRVFAAVLATLVLFLLAQRLLRPATWGLFGHYRAGSLTDIMSGEPVHQGEQICAECHREIHQTHEGGIHAPVACEDCHGPGRLHVQYHRAKERGELGANGSASDEAAAMPKTYTLEGCLYCHRRLAARPASFAQIDLEEHYRLLHVTDLTIPCIACHSPHGPLFLIEDVATARIHPIIFKCANCHDDTPAESHKTVKDHPAIFVCGDCHSAIVTDFEEHIHSFLACTDCHLFHQENQVSGRIFKNKNSLFCLLCHAKAEFKDEQALPQVVHAEHAKEMAPAMRKPPVSSGEEPMACTDCHFDIVHDNRLIKRLQELKR